MKRFMVKLPVWFVALFALNFLAHGANPSYTAFIGTNGIVVTSNPPSGRVIIDGRDLTNGFTGGGNLTTNANQFLGVPLSIKSGALLTNTVTTNAGFQGAVTNFMMAPQFLGTNVVFDGSLSSWFQFNPFTGPETNYIFTNIAAGQTIKVMTFVTNGTTVRLWVDTTEIPAAWYVGNNGTAPNLNSNAYSILTVSRDPVVPTTNVVVQTRDLEAVPGANITFTTNFIAGTVTIASSGGGSVAFSDLVWTNDQGNIKPVAFPTNVIFNPTNAGVGSGGISRTKTNFLFQTSTRRIGGTNQLFMVMNGGASAFVVSDQGIMIGSTNFIPVPQAAIDIAYDTAFGVDTPDKSILLASYDSIQTYRGEVTLDVSTNRAGLALIADKEGNGATQLIETVGGNSSQWENYDLRLLVINAGNTLITPYQIDPDYSLSPTGYIFGSTFRITNTHTLVSLQNSNTPVFEVDGIGDLKLLKRVAYSWPSVQGSSGSVLTNNGSGVLGWGASAGGSGPTFADLIWTNNTDVIYPFVHSNRIHFGTSATNGARINLEYYSRTRSLRVGQLSTGTGNDYWDVTNLGICSVAFGSNNLAGAYMSAVLGGHGNLIPTNTPLSTISGGNANTIGINGARNFIGSGSENQIDPTVTNSIIAAGHQNRIYSGKYFGSILGGSGNQVREIFGTVVGGIGNDARGTYGFIGGGLNNVCSTAASDTAAVIGGGSANQTDTSYATIAGGNNNRVNTSADNGTIGGGLGNNTDGPNSTIGGGVRNVTENLAEYSVIAGGYTNYISSASDASFSFISGGVSNRVTAAPLAAVIGSFGTNATPKSVLISPIGPNGSNRVHVTATATTNIGPLKVSAGNAFVAGNFASVGGTLSVDSTPVASAGSAETNLITRSIPAHTLTNNGDRLVIRASGRFAATANAKQIKLIFGSETILDTSSQIVNSGAWTIEAEIIRTGNTSQSVSAEYHGSGESLYTTGASLDLAQTNGIATVLKLTSTATGNGDVTNRTLTVEWAASP